jgi:lon-related putative ATP-dependent protease
MHPQPYELAPEEVVFSLAIDGAAGTESRLDATVIGQSRAMAALSLGLNIPAKGYNIFIMGAPGTGRRTALLKALSEYKRSPLDPQDKVFVANFAKPLEPTAINFPAGQARQFKHDIHDLIEDVKRLSALHGASEAFSSRRGAVVSEMEKTENKALAEFESEVVKAGFQLVQLETGENQAADLVPIRDGVPTSFDDLQTQVATGALTAEAWNSLRENYYGLMDRMKAVFDSVKRSRAQLDHRVSELRREMLAPLVTASIDALKRKYLLPAVDSWLELLKADIIDHLFFFSRERLEQERDGRRRHSPTLARYGVNVLIDRTDTTVPPVVFENRPSLINLVGSIDQGGDPGEEVRAGFLRIRAGSLLKAAGGVLVLRAEDIVEDADTWSYLKRVLQTGKMEIQAQPGPFAAPSTLKPEPLDIALKVVLIGGELSYDALYQTDPDFQKLFKVCAEFDSETARTPEAEREYLAFFRKIVAEEGLRPLSQDGAVAVLERAVRDAGRRDKLSTRFSYLSDLLREADYWAGRDGRSQLDAAAVRRAVDMRAHLHKLPEDKLEGMMLSGEILMALSGEAVGKANGLAVHDRGYYAFGLPTVVSARVAPGDGGVVNIEGESGLSGEIFDKAVLILSGYLRSRYARGFPLSITASVCFEQSYTAIDGDSATAVQLCVILSAIAGIPLRQDLAITGSVNQNGIVQPVGGVIEKVEGFYSICAKKGLSGSQGVVVPRRNMDNLLLGEEIEKAVKNGLFHIYAVDTIDQALEVLSGRPAGEADKNGLFPENSLNGAISRELKRMADVIRRYET